MTEIHDSIRHATTPTSDRESIAFRRVFALGLLAAILVAATPFVFQAYGDTAYMALAIPTGFVAAAASWVVCGVRSGRIFWLIIAFAILLRVFTLFFDPLLSSDVYRYVWDGKVQAAGINPYRYIPANEALSALRDQAIFPRINRVDYAVTIYPPVAQMFYFLATRFGESINAMRIGLLACEGVTVVMIVLLLRRMAQPATHVAAYAWHPLPIWEIANSAHVDALMVALVMVGLTLAIFGRPLRGAVAIALGVLVKPFALFALPGIWRAWDWRMPLVVIAVIALCYLPYLSVGSGVFGSLTHGYFSEEGLATGGKIWPLVVWRSVFGAFPGDTIIYFAIAALIMVALSLQASYRDPRDAASILGDVKWLLMATVLLVSPNYPWYFLVLTPFVALSGGLPVWTVTIGALLLQDELDWDYWIPQFTRKSVLYGAFLVACAYTIWRMSQLRQPERQKSSRQEQPLI